MLWRNSKENIWGLQKKQDVDEKESEYLWWQTLTNKGGKCGKRYKKELGEWNKEKECVGNVT